MSHEHVGKRLEVSSAFRWFGIKIVFASSEDLVKDRKKDAQPAMSQTEVRSC